MKSFLLLVALLLSGLFCRAEYGGAFVHVAVTTTDNEVIEGYAYMASSYFKKDSLNNSAYLLHFLDRASGRPNDTIELHQHLLKYTYGRPDTDNAEAIYTQLDPEIVLRANLASAKLLDITEQNYDTNIASDHTLDDLYWMQFPVKHEFSCGTEFTTYTLYFHDHTETTDELLAALRVIETAHQAVMSLLWQQEGWARDTDDREKMRAIEKDIEQAEDAYWTQLQLVLDACEEEDIVIVGMYSC